MHCKKDRCARLALTLGGHTPNIRRIFHHFPLVFHQLILIARKLVLLTTTLTVSTTAGTTATIASSLMLSEHHMVTHKCT